MSADTHRKALAVLLLLTASLAGASAVVDVYRCQIGKKTVYQDAPCDNGKVVDNLNGHPVDPNEFQRAQQRLARAAAEEAARKRNRARASLPQPVTGTPASFVPAATSAARRYPDRYYDRPDRYYTRQ